MKFREETIKEFNLYCDTTLAQGMTFDQVVDNIDEANNSYFYISMCKDDVVEAINSNKEIADQLDLDKVYIREVGVYIALHP